MCAFVTHINLLPQVHLSCLKQNWGNKVVCTQRSPKHKILLSQCWEILKTSLFIFKTYILKNCLFDFGKEALLVFNSWVFLHWRFKAIYLKIKQYKELKIKSKTLFYPKPCRPIPQAPPNIPINSVFFQKFSMHL